MLLENYTQLLQSVLHTFKPRVWFCSPPLKIRNSHWLIFVIIPFWTPSKPLQRILFATTCRTPKATSTNTYEWPNAKQSFNLIIFAWWLIMLNRVPSNVVCLLDFAITSRVIDMLVLFPLKLSFMIAFCFVWNETTRQTTIDNARNGTFFVHS